MTRLLLTFRVSYGRHFIASFKFIHVVVVKEGSVTVICYAPHYIMGTLVQMAKKSKSMLLENSVSYLSIGYTVVLDSTDQEVSYWYYMMSESDTNVSF